MPRKIRPIRFEGNLAFIPLTQGLEAVIDASDAPLIDAFSWCAHKRRNSSYAVTNTRFYGGGMRTIGLHRMLLGDPSNIDIDHQNRNGLDNRRDNLRTATKSQNRHNQGAHKNNTSGFKGVSFQKGRGLWRAAIMANRKSVHLGYFDTPEEAHAAYCKASAELHGEFANFG